MNNIILIDPSSILFFYFQLLCLPHYLLTLSSFCLPAPSSPFCISLLFLCISFFTGNFTCCPFSPSFPWQDHPYFSPILITINYGFTISILDAIKYPSSISPSCISLTTGMHISVLYRVCSSKSCHLQQISLSFLTLAPPKIHLSCYPKWKICL